MQQNKNQGSSGNQEFEYPDGRVLTSNYGTAGGKDDAASRIAALIDDDVSSTHLADYSTLGLATSH